MSMDVKLKVYIYMAALTVFGNVKIFIQERQVKVKQKYRGVFETQRSGDKTSSRGIGLNIRKHASSKLYKTRCPKE